jgi:hypothetical protein
MSALPPEAMWRYQASAARYGGVATLGCSQQHRPASLHAACSDEDAHELRRRRLARRAARRLHQHALRAGGARMAVPAWQEGHRRRRVHAHHALAHHIRGRRRVGRHGLRVGTQQRRQRWRLRCRCRGCHRQQLRRRRRWWRGAIDIGCRQRRTRRALQRTGRLRRRRSSSSFIRCVTLRRSQRQRHRLRARRRTYIQSRLLRAASSLLVRKRSRLDWWRDALPPLCPRRWRRSGRRRRGRATACSSARAPPPARPRRDVRLRRHGSRCSRRLLQPEAPHRRQHFRHSVHGVAQEE